MASRSAAFQAEAYSAEVDRVAERPGAISLAVRTNLVAAAIWSATAAVAALGILRQSYIIRFGHDTALHNLRIFDLDGEQTIPAWYSSMLMWTAAGLLALQAALASSTRQRTRWHWWVLAAIFAYLSLDESVNFHEMGS